MRLLIDDRLGSFDYDAALLSVSRQRREQVLRYRKHGDRLSSLAAYSLLQKALMEEYDIAEPPVFEYAAGGKPGIAGHPEIFFSISHCSEAVACVVDDKPVGVDIEHIELLDVETIAATMSDEEQRVIYAARNPVAAFAAFWTKKESLLKLTGEGLRNDMRAVLTDSQALRSVEFRTIIKPRYVCSACFHIE